MTTLFPNPWIGKTIDYLFIERSLGSFGDVYWLEGRDPNTGQVFWLVTPQEHGVSDDAMVAWCDDIRVLQEFSLAPCLTPIRLFVDTESSQPFAIYESLVGAVSLQSLSQSLPGEDLATIFVELSDAIEALHLFYQKYGHGKTRPLSQPDRIWVVLSAEGVLVRWFLIPGCDALVETTVETAKTAPSSIDVLPDVPAPAPAPTSAPAPAPAPAMDYMEREEALAPPAPARKGGGFGGLIGGLFGAIADGVEGRTKPSSIRQQEQEREQSSGIDEVMERQPVVAREEKPAEEAPKQRLGAKKKAKTEESPEQDEGGLKKEVQPADKRRARSRRSIVLDKERDEMDLEEEVATWPQEAEPEGGGGLAPAAPRPKPATTTPSKAAATSVEEDSFAEELAWERSDISWKSDSIEEKTARILRRKGVVRSYTQMNPGKIFPLLVSIVEAEMYIKIPNLPQVQQIESDKVLQIKESSPYLRIVPVLPGCIISPPEAVVDVREKKVDVEFWIAPQAEGDLTRSARIQIWHEDLLKDEIPVPCTVVTQTLTKIASYFSVFSSLFGAIFETYGKKWTADPKVLSMESTSMASYVLQKTVGLLSSSGIWLGLFFLLTAFLCYLWLKPREGDVIERFLSTEVH